MLVVETIAKIRRAYFSQGKAIKEICRDLHVSRKVVRKVIRSNATEFHYERSQQPLPRIGPWREQLEALLDENDGRLARERLTLIRIFEDLRALGYGGSYAAVRRYAIAWREKRAGATADAYVPLSFAPGEAYQFDWSHEIALIGGVTTTLKVAHVRLCHSRMMFVRAYPRESQEMVFDAHDRAFAFFKGACTRGIYDNMQTAVDTVFVGKARQYNRRFVQMCSHHLVEPVACTPAAGWEKGQVENQVGLVRERFFVPKPRFPSYDELNAWLLDRCLMWAKAHPHPERPEETIWEVFEEERPKLVPYRGRFDGFHALPASVSKTCRPRCRRPAWCGSTTTNIRSTPARSGARSRFMLTPAGSPSARMGGLSPSTRAHWAAARSSTIPGITCLCWRANPARSGMAPRSRTGSCPAPWSASVASSRAPTTATARWSRFSPPC
jgi:transposase